MRMNLKKSKENEKKIINDVLKSTPFHPQTSKSSKYNYVDSRIKKNWVEEPKQKN